MSGAILSTSVVAHQLAALAVGDGVGALGIERLDERVVLPEVTAVVLLALGRGADVAERSSG